EVNYLIDGYNLLHALGAVRKRAGPRDLEKARFLLLDLLRNTYGDAAAHVTVVFDAAQAPPRLPETEEFHGIHVRYAIHEKQADDLRGVMLGSERAPESLTVFPDDHRIKRAARRGRCIVMGCGAFLDWLMEQRRKSDRPQAPPTPASADRASRAE